MVALMKEECILPINIKTYKYKYGIGIDKLQNLNKETKFSLYMSLQK